MMKRSLLLLCFGVVLLVIVGVFLFFEQKNDSSSSQNYLVPSPSATSYEQMRSGVQISKSVPSQQGSTSPQDIVRAFYTWYLSSPQNPVTSGAYLQNKYLSYGLKSQIKALSSHNTTYDPLLCNQNKSDNFVVGDPAYNNLGDQAKVVVSANVANGKDLYRFVLDHANGKWLISDVICIP